jgi:hypothetical protein
MPQSVAAERAGAPPMFRPEFPITRQADGGDAQLRAAPAVER